MSNCRQDKWPSTEVVDYTAWAFATIGQSTTQLGRRVCDDRPVECADVCIFGEDSRTRPAEFTT